MHYDHAGGLNLFPNAAFHIQDRELGFCTGRSMGHDVLRWAFDVDDVLGAVRLSTPDGWSSDGRGDRAGVTVHLIGGHTDGLQVVRVPTERGWVVLASDATHLWSNIRTRNPFPIVANVTEMLDGYATIEALADGPDHVIPGHDPLVLARFPTLDGQARHCSGRPASRPRGLVRPGWPGAPRLPGPGPGLLPSRMGDAKPGHLTGAGVSYWLNAHRTGREGGNVRLGKEQAIGVIEEPAGAAGVPDDQPERERRRGRAVRRRAGRRHLASLRLCEQGALIPG